MQSLTETLADEPKSRSNAVSHGLTAKTLLPEVFGRDQIEQMYQTLAGELQPQTGVQEYLVRELARHYVALQRCELMEGGAMRHSANYAMGRLLKPPVSRATEDDPDARLDNLLASMGKSEALEKVSRYRRMHERAAERALETLKQLQEKALPPSPSGGLAASKPGHTPRFLTDHDCQCYLARRWRDGLCKCPGCGGSIGSTHTDRGVWQCVGCRKQVSLRAGTLLASSRIGLRNWFQLIEAVLRDPQASITQLAAASGLDRRGTVRKLADRIREPLAGPDASQLLAGLDVVFADGGR
jgi:hypothetical protein